MNPLDLLIPPIEHLLAAHFVPCVHTYIIYLPEDHYQLRNPTYNTIRTSEAVEEAENNEGQQQEEEDGEYNYVKLGGVYRHLFMHIVYEHAWQIGG